MRRESSSWINLAGLLVAIVGVVFSYLQLTRAGGTENADAIDTAAGTRQSIYYSDLPRLSKDIVSSQLDRISILLRKDGAEDQLVNANISALSDTLSAVSLESQMRNALQLLKEAVSEDKFEHLVVGAISTGNTEELIEQMQAYFESNVDLVAERAALLHKSIGAMSFLLDSAASKSAYESALEINDSDEEALSAWGYLFLNHRVDALQGVVSTYAASGDFSARSGVAPANIADQDSVAENLNTAANAVGEVVDTSDFSRLAEEFGLLSSAESNAKPVYTFRYIVNGAYFLTISESERAHISSQLSWQYEFLGAIGFAYDNLKSNSGRAVYRFYNGMENKHGYSIGSADVGLAKSLGWIYEGIAFYL